jgi:N-methylhydantoinase B
LSLWFERSRTTAWGLFGGESGKAPVVTVEEPGAEPAAYLKVNSRPLKAGTVVTTRTGGGGYGAPASRNPDRVRSDVLEGYVSREAAQKQDRVVLDDELNVDVEATASLRAAIPGQ